MWEWTSAHQSIALCTPICENDMINYNLNCSWLALHNDDMEALICMERVREIGDAIGRRAFSSAALRTSTCAASYTATATHGGVLRNA